MEPAIGHLRVQPRGDHFASTNAARARLRFWLAPDLAMFAAILTLFYCLFLFEGYWKLFRDSDTGWHIRNGETIAATRALPRTDPYSFSRPGAEWFAWEWGADLMMGAAHRWDGLRGVAALYLSAIALCTWLWFRLHWAAGGDFLVACVLASPMLSTVNLHWLARPHVFGWAMLLVAVLLAVRWSEGRPRSRDLALVAVFSAVWANLHASFFLAAAVAAAYAIHHAVRPLIWELDRENEWPRARWFALASAAALAGSLVNPYGWKLHAHVARYLFDSELLPRVGEFQSFNFHAEGAGQILLGLAIAAAGAMLALQQRNVAHFLIAAGLLAIALRSARGLPVAALVLLPLANGAIASALRRARAIRPRIRARLDAALHYSSNLRAIDTRFRGLAWAPVAVVAAALCLWIPSIAARTGFPPGEFPVAAAGQVAGLPKGARILAPDKFGGYLIYHFAGSRKVFFDGRSDFYGADFMKQYIRLVQVRPGWQDQLARFDFTHALLPRDYSLVAALKEAGWDLVYEDRTAVLLQEWSNHEERSNH